MSRYGIVMDDNVPESAKLGYLVGIVHERVRIPVEELDKLFDETSFPENLRPGTPRAQNAFQAAVRQLAEKTTERFVDPQSGISVDFNVEYFIDVLPGDVRQLSRKIQYQSSGNVINDCPDDIKKLLEIYVEKTQKEPEKMALFELNRGDETISRTDLFKSNQLNIKEQTDEKTDELDKVFITLKDCYTERYLKEAWFKMIHEINGIPYIMAQGSVWFIPKDGKELLDSFINIYTTVHKGGGTVRVLPVIDTEQQRQYLKSDAEKYIKSKYETFLKNVAKEIENVKNQEDVEKAREKLGDKKDKFEQEMKDSLIKQYNELLGMSISAKTEAYSPKSERLRIAQEYLRKL